MSKEQKDDNANHGPQYTIQKTKYLTPRTPLNAGEVELRCSGKVSSSCSTSDTRRVIHVKIPVIRHKR